MVPRLRAFGAPLGMTTAATNLRVGRDGAAGHITLDRPEKLNALSLEMMRAAGTVLDDWAFDPAIRFVVLDGAGPRGFCAGGDIAYVRASVLAGDGRARTYWATEYGLDAKVARFPKPVVVVAHGIVMGGGVGLSVYAPHRIVTESTKWAMPEVGIGLFPDCGTSWVFSRAPGESGTYLALTGRTLGAADVIALGFADHCVPEARIAGLKEAFFYDELHDDVDLAAAIACFAVPPGEAPLAPHRALIDRTFAYDTVEKILEALRTDDSAFAREAAAEIGTKSPTSLKVTLRMLRRARSFAQLEDALRLDYRLMCGLSTGHDFAEGIRAAVIDKDRNPAWQPASLAEVTAETVDGYFAEERA